MKNFVIIFLSMFFVGVSAKATDCEIYRLAASQNPENAAAATTNYNNCMADKKKETAEAECKAAITSYNEALTESNKTKEENRKEAQDKLLDLKKEKEEIISDAQEAIANAQKEAQDAEIAYGEAQKNLQDALDAFEKQTNEQGQELVKEIQNLMAKLEENLTVKRDELNTEYQNSIMQGYEACKQSAEQLFMSKLGLIRDTNKKQNGGYTFSGGANLARPSQIKKARNEAKKAHQTCIAETKRVLEAKRAAALQKLTLEEKRLNQELTAKQQELDRITNSEYKKKLQSLEQELVNAQKRLIAAQEKAKKDQERLARKMTADQTTYDTQIALVSARANDGLSATGNVLRNRRTAREDASVAGQKAEVCNICAASDGTYSNSRARSICNEPPRRRSSGSTGDGAG